MHIKYIFIHEKRHREDDGLFQGTERPVLDPRGCIARHRVPEWACQRNPRRMSECAQGFRLAFAAMEAGEKGRIRRITKQDYPGDPSLPQQDIAIAAPDWIPTDDQIIRYSRVKRAGRNQVDAGNLEPLEKASRYKGAAPFR